MLISSSAALLLTAIGLLSGLGVADVRAAGTLELVLAATPAGEVPQGAVVSLHSAQAALRVSPTTAQMDQRDRQFEPALLIIGPGSRVEFPNSDDIRHHVYSFSPTRRFELPLYSGKPALPIDFPEPGVVAVGCNIHDWMRAHILVLDTPYYARVEQAKVSLSAPAGAYVLRVWHPRLAQDPPWLTREVELIEAGFLELRLELPLAAAEAPRLSDDAQLRALQERFRALRKER